MQFFSIIGPLAVIAGLVSASVLPARPVLPVLPEDEKARQMIGRISNPLAYSSRPIPGEEFIPARPALPVLPEDEKARQMMGRISNPLAYSSRPIPGEEFIPARPALPVLPGDEKARQMMGRISNPLAYSPRPIPGQEFIPAHPSRPQPAISAMKRSDSGFYFCTNADYQGLCYRDQSPFGTCVSVEDDLAGVPDHFGNTVSSASVNWGSQCVLFRDSHCQGPNVTVAYPGSHNLFFNDFNDVMSSFRCNEV